MHLTIIAPDKKVFEGAVQKVTLPGSAGAFQVLKGHAAMVSTLKKGSILYKDEIRDYVLTTEGGLVEVCNNNVTVLVEAGYPR